MKLILRLADATEAGQSRTLETDGSKGGTLSIGRGAENLWVLADPDRTLSKHHCRIDASEGGFMLTDLSTNGVFMTGAAQPVGRGHSVALEDGDSFTMGPYRMQAEITGGADAAMDLSGGIMPQGASPLAPSIEEPWLTGVPGGEFGPGRRAAPQGWDAPPDPATYAASGLFEQPGTGGSRLLPDDPFAAAPGLFSQQAEHIPAASTNMRLPEAQVVLPTDWMDSDPMEPAPAPAPAAAPAPALAWPPVLPEAPPPPEPAPALPPEWASPVQVEAVSPALPDDWGAVSAVQPAPQALVPVAVVPAEILPPEPPAPAPAPVPAEPPPPPPLVIMAPAPPPTPLLPSPQPLAAHKPRPAALRPVPAPVPTPAPASAAAEAGAPPPDGLLAAFLEGAGLPADTLAGLDTAAAFHEIGQLVRAAVEGVRDIMSTRALVKSEFRVDQTVLRRSENNQVKFAPDTQRCLAAMVGAAPPGFLPGSAAMQQSMDDIKAHELALVAALNSVFADMGQQLDPEAIMRRAKQDTGFATMLPYAREARCWAIFMETYRLLQESGAANTGGSLLAPLAQAYARQLRRGR